FSVDSAKLGYFVLNNAANNDTAIAVVAEIYDFLLVHRRLRCGPHTLNLIGQTLLWGNNQQAYDNAPKELSDEVRFMREWRKDGPLGVLLDVINYIKTPQQHKLFINFQHRANADLSAKDRKILKTVNEYLAILRPLKLATKRLKGRGTYKRFGLLAKVIPVFETILSSYEERV
ncbi:hypothetical protein PtrSN001C_012091, partial [Pyrenophora tritici-repentis]